MSERVVHVVISGEVQGVGYRAWTATNARRLGLAGWVRNRRSGDVEACFAGAQAAVEAMLAACREGPSHARVSDVCAQESGPADIVENAFVVKETT